MSPGVHRPFPLVRLWQDDIVPDSLLAHSGHFLCACRMFAFVDKADTAMIA
jgi:hypothetical protein